MCKHCWDDEPEPHHKDYIRGGVDVSDFDEVVRYRHPKRRKPKERYPRERGCIGNNYGPHVYVWTTETNDKKDPFYTTFGYHKNEYRVCAGCGAGWKSRHTERYEKTKERKWIKRTGGPFNVKRGEPVRRYGWRYHSYYGFKWEDDFPEFIEARQAFMKARGLNWYRNY